MLVRLCAFLILLVVCNTHPSMAQAAQNCLAVPGLCNEQAPKFDFQFQFDIKLKPNPVKPRRAPKPPIKIVAKRPPAQIPIYTPKPAQQKMVVIIKKPVSKPISMLVSVPMAPQHSWDGLPEIPVSQLTAEDLTDIEGQYIIDFNVVALTAAGVDLKTISNADLAIRLGIPESRLRSVQRRFMLSAVLRASKDEAEALRHNPFVSAVHADTRIKAAGKSLPLSWGLDRLDSPSLPIDGKFDRKSGDYAARIYLFDSGVIKSPSEFGSRVSFGASFSAGPNQSPTTCNQHGTEMASLIVGSTTGSAPKAEIVDLVVLPCDREKTGEASNLIEAAEWLLIREVDHGDGKPAIANMSLAGKWSQKINSAVSILTSNGIVVVAAAGNNAQDACRFSPASAKDAITVAATGPDDTTPGFSNFGPCVKINAPGRLLTAFTSDKNAPYVAINGTSGATALVSGLLARSLKNKGPQAAANWLKEAAIPAVLWRKDATNMLLAQTSPKWRKSCRVASDIQGGALPLYKSRNGKIIGSLPQASLVNVETSSAGWALVNAANGQQGWVQSHDDHMALLLRADTDIICAGLL